MTEQQALFEGLKQRDPDALALAFERYSDKIYRLAVSILHDEQQADGVVQDTFIKLIDAVDSFEGRAQISTWLYRVAYNECLGRLRRAKPDISVDVLLDDDFMPENFTRWECVPDEVLNNNEALQQMEAAVEQLSPALRGVFTLRDVEGLSVKETAAILGISEAAVKVRLHRARLLLRETLADYFEEYVRP